MSVLFSIFLLLFCFCVNVSAQQFEVSFSTYTRQKFNEEEARRFNEKPQGKEQLKANEEPPAETYKLIISDKESSFTYQDRIANNQGQIFDIRYPIAGMGTTYHNLQDSVQMKDIGEIYGKMYHSMDSLQMFNWEISSEKKEILGFETRKATAINKDGTAIVAWYAPKIAVSHGPGDFWGLPGLILELEKNYHNERNRKDFYFAESIKETKKAKVIKPTKGIQIKESDLEVIYQEGRKRQQEMNAQEVEKD